jgi:segregation and condensation protein A
MSEVDSHTAIARLYGEPLFELPRDLYIPPNALEVFLEAFEGPLDLLLYLIRKQNFNILDIPMAGVTQQYMDYVEEIRKRNLELAADYLLMAAMLIEIKSRMLLPPRKNAQESAQTQDPRADLVRRLLEYEQIKLAAVGLATLPQYGRDMLKAQVHTEQPQAIRYPDLNASELYLIWRSVIGRTKLLQKHRITREELSVREYMGLVLRALTGRKFALFEDLIDRRRGAPVLVVTFVALLELAREHRVDLTQAEAYAPIYIRLAFTSR